MSFPILKRSWNITWGDGTTTSGAMTGTLTSDTLDTYYATYLSIHLHSASNTHVGTITLYASNTGSDWNAISLSSSVTASNGSALDAIIELKEYCPRYLRVVYTYTSGTGTLTGTIVGKK
jgi:hypothetical protein